MTAMLKREPAFIDGRMVDEDPARVSIDALHARFSVGFFETVRTSGGRLHAWDLHRERLERACATAGVPLRPTALALDRARFGEVVKALNQRSGYTDAVFRYTVAGRGAGHEFVSVRALPAPAPAKGIRLRVLAQPRQPAEWLPRPKSLNYADALSALEELARRGASPSDEGLFLANAGPWALETPRQNLGWIAGGQLYHADPALGAIPGTGLEWLRRAGFPLGPARASIEELCVAEAIFVCNAVRGITPVREVWDAQDRPLLPDRDSAAHPVIQRMQARWTAGLARTAEGAS